MTEWLHSHFSFSCIGECNGNPLQCFCLENPREGGACWAAVYVVSQSRTRLKQLSSSSSSLRNSQESSQTPQFESINSSALRLLYGPTRTSIYDYWKTIALPIWIIVSKAMSLLFNMQSRFVITFFPRNKHLLNSWLQSPPIVILEPRKIKSVTADVSEGES